MEQFIQECRRSGISPIQSGLEDFLRDESRFTGSAWGMVRAESEHDVVRVMQCADRWNVPVTVAAGQTSLTGASVPTGGIVLDVKKLAWIDAEDLTRVGPGTILKDYQGSVAGEGYFFPPDPTSADSCTLGGMVACNASGALSYLHGPTRSHIRGLRVVLADGRILSIERGQIASHNDRFIVPGQYLTPHSSTELIIPVPRTGAPPWKTSKTAAGLYSEEPFDLVDLFIGSEGILGVVTEIRTLLAPKRSPYFGLMLYVPSRQQTVALVEFLDSCKRYFHDKEADRKTILDAAIAQLGVRGSHLSFEDLQHVVPSCMEWLGSSCAGFLSGARRQKLDGRYGCLYIEQDYPLGDNVWDYVSRWADLIESFNRLWGPDLRPVDTEAALDAKQIREMRGDRLSVPEKLNESIAPGNVKIGTDFSVPMEHLEWVLTLYDETLPKGRSFIFGHIGNAHVHTNILPQSDEEAAEARALYIELASRVCRRGGSVSGEHGIGKLKHRALEIMLGHRGIEEIRKVKAALDPKNLLNRDNMIDLHAKA